MKKLKKLSIMCFVIILIMGVTSVVFAKTALDVSDKKEIYLGYSSMAYSYNNLYCIEHRQALNDPITFNIKTKVEINGKTAKFYTRDKDGEYELRDTIEHEYNNVLAAIVTSGNIDGKTSQKKPGEPYTYGYSNPGGGTGYSDAQLGLYKFMPTWINKMKELGELESLYGITAQTRRIDGNRGKNCRSGY